MTSPVNPGTFPLNPTVRVVHLCSSGRVGGVETSVLAMLGSLREAEPAWEIAVVAPEDGPLLDGVRRLGFGAVSEPFPRALAAFGEVSAAGGMGVRLRAGVSAAAYAERLRRVLRAREPDIVHAHGIKMQVLSRWSAPGRSALVWHVHDYTEGRPASGRALRAASHRCRVAIANSHSVAEDFRHRVRAAAPVRVIHNAVDLARFAPDGPRLDLDAQSPGGAADAATVRIGLPAAFGRWKGQDVFLRALGRLASRGGWRAYVIGGSVYRTRGSQWSLEQLESLAQQLGLADRVVFTGILHDMPAALRALDVVVHASTQPEPFGMVIAEAMACGRATVVARGGGATEIIHERTDALAYAPGDDEELSRVLGSLLSDVDLRARLGAEARRTATEAFDARRLGPELATVYRAALAHAA